MTDNGTESGVEIKYSANCSDSILNGCNNVHVGETILFTASITAKSCSDKTQLIKIKRENSPGDITLELDVHCECNCQEKSEPNAPECNAEGAFECGICNCNPGRYGSTCECDNDSPTNNTDSCRMDINDSTICSGRGKNSYMEEHDELCIFMVLSRSLPFSLSIVGLLLSHVIT